METQSISLNVHPQIIDLYEVLEKNGLHKQKEDVQSLVGYIESMEYNLSVMMRESAPSAPKSFPRLRIKYSRQRL